MSRLFQRRRRTNTNDLEMEEDRVFAEHKENLTESRRAKSTSTGAMMPGDDRLLFHRKSLEEGPVLPASYFRFEQVGDYALRGDIIGLLGSLSGLEQGRSPSNEDLRRGLQYLRMPELHEMLLQAAKSESDIDVKRRKEIEAVVQSWNLGVEMTDDFLERFNSDDLIQKLASQIGAILSSVTSGLLPPRERNQPEAVPTMIAHEIFLGEDTDRHRYYLQGREKTSRKVGPSKTVGPSKMLLQSTEWNQVVQSLRLLIGPERQQFSMGNINENIIPGVQFYVKLFSILRRVFSERGYSRIGEEEGIQFEPGYKTTFKDRIPRKQASYEAEWPAGEVSVSNIAWQQEEPPARIVKMKEEAKAEAGWGEAESRKETDYNLDETLRKVSERVDETFGKVEAISREESTHAISGGPPPRSFPSGSLSGGGVAIHVREKETTVEDTGERALFEGYSDEPTYEEYREAPWVSIGSTGRAEAAKGTVGGQSDPSFEPRVSPTPSVTDELLELFNSVDDNSRPFLINSVQFIMDILYLIDRSSGIAGGRLPELLTAPLDTVVTLLERVSNTNMKPLRISTRNLMNSFEDAHWDWKDYLFDQLKFIKDSLSASSGTKSENTTENEKTSEFKREFTSRKDNKPKESTSRTREPRQRREPNREEYVGGASRPSGKPLSATRTNYVGSQEWRQRADSLQDRIDHLPKSGIREAFSEWIAELQEVVNSLMTSEFAYEWMTEWYDQFSQVARIILSAEEKKDLVDFISERTISSAAQGTRLLQLLRVLLVKLPITVAGLLKELPMLLVPFWVRQFTSIDLPRLFVRGDHLSYYLDNLKLTTTDKESWDWRFISIQDWKNKSKKGSRMRGTRERDIARREMEANLDGRGHQDWEAFRRQYVRRFREQEQAQARYQTGRRASTYKIYDDRPWFSGLKVPRYKNGRYSSDSEYSYPRYSNESEYSHEYYGDYPVGYKSTSAFEPFEKLSSRIRRKPLYERDFASHTTRESVESLEPRTTGLSTRMNQRYLLSCTGMHFALKDVHFGYLLKSKWLLTLPHNELMDEGIMDIELGGIRYSKDGTRKGDGGPNDSEWSPSVVERHSVVSQRSHGVSFFLEVGSPQGSLESLS